MLRMRSGLQTVPSMPEPESKRKTSERRVGGGGLGETTKWFGFGRFVEDVKELQALPAEAIRAVTPAIRSRGGRSLGAIPGWRRAFSALVPVAWVSR